MKNLWTEITHKHVCSRDLQKLLKHDMDFDLQSLSRGRCRRLLSDQVGRVNPEIPDIMDVVRKGYHAPGTRVYCPSNWFKVDMNWPISNFSLEEKVRLPRNPSYPKKFSCIYTFIIWDTKKLINVNKNFINVTHYLTSRKHLTPSCRQNVIKAVLMFLPIIWNEPTGMSQSVPSSSSLRVGMGEWHILIYQTGIMGYNRVVANEKSVRSKWNRENKNGPMMFLVFSLVLVISDYIPNNWKTLFRPTLQNGLRSIWVRKRPLVRCGSNNRISNHLTEQGLEVR